MSRTGVPVVAFDRVSKLYPNGTKALTDVSFAIAANEIHAICGENGAGKSTLMQLLAGVERPTAGRIAIDGKPAALTSPNVAAGHGVGMVHQHFSLLPSLTVAENVVLGREPRRCLFLDIRAAKERVRRLSQSYGLHVEPDALVSSLSVAARQKVEIIKALALDLRILILDEPTAVLAPLETNELFERLRGLRDNGVTILFISHKLREVRALADRVTVIRAGRVAGTGTLADLDDARIARLVMGHDVQGSRRTPRPASPGAPVVVAQGATLQTAHAADRLLRVDVTVHAGEIVGVAGVDGSGQGSLVDLLSGSAQPDGGSILFHGRDMRGRGTHDWRHAGMAHLPADRFHVGGAPAMSLVDNAVAGAHRSRKFSRGPFLRPAAMIRHAAAMIEAYGVRCGGPAEPLRSLSGGNAQKLIAAREFATEPSFLIADQPTRGIDVAAAAQIHARLLAMAAGGTAILLVTADLDELLRLAHRVVVLHGGEVTGQFENGPGLTQERLGPAMLGLERAA